MAILRRGLLHRSLLVLRTRFQCKRLRELKAQSRFGGELNVAIAGRSADRPCSGPYQCPDGCTLAAARNTANRYRCSFSLSSGSLVEASSLNVVLVAFYGDRIELQGKDGSAFKPASFLCISDSACNAGTCGNRHFSINRDRSGD